MWHLLESKAGRLAGFLKVDGAIDHRMILRCFERGEACVRRMKELVKLRFRRGDAVARRAALKAVRWRNIVCSIGCLEGWTDFWM